MRHVSWLLILVAVLGFCSGTAAAQRQRPAGFFPPELQRAVPGIDAAVTITAEQKEKLAAVRSKTLQSEAYRTAVKTARDKNATKADRKAAQEKLTALRAELQEQTQKVLTGEQRELVAKLNSVVRDVRGQVRQEYREKFRAARGNKEEQQKLRKEIAGKVQAEMSAKVLSLLTDEQKKAVQRAAQEVKRGKRGKGETPRGKKKAKKKGKDGQDKGRRERKGKSKRGKKKEKEGDTEKTFS